MTIGELPKGFAQIKAREMWIDGIGWDLTCILPYVTDDRRLELAAVVVDSVTGAKDRLAWGENPDGRLTIKSVYGLLTRDDRLRQDMGRFFQRLWRVKVPERIRVFLWLVVNQATMTNQERYRRHIGDTELCKVCKGGVESILHVLRDCPAMVGI